MLKKTNYFFIRLFKKSINFKIPTQSSILLFGKKSEILKKTIKKNNLSKFVIDRQEINLFIYILTLLKGEISFVNYSKTFIQVVNPKIVITYIDNDINFYQLKYFYPNKYFIAIQNGYRFRSRDFIDNLVEAKKEKIPLKIDYYLCFNKYYANYCKKFIQFNSILHGSYRNNLNKLTKVKKLKKDLLFISQYSPVTDSVKEHSIFYSLEKKLLPIVEEYCFKNKLNLIIMLRNNKKASNYNNEVSFYKSFLNNKLKDVKEKNSYSLLDKYENILSIDSTLGYEALVRNKKVFFFHNRSVKYNNRKFKDLFGWPKPSRKNDFSINIDEKNINQYLKSNLNLSYKKWLKINNKHFNDLMVFDYKNKKLSKIIQSCLKKEKNSNFIKKL
jgi:surface carbohydrate biosynthesis protein